MAAPLFTTNDADVPKLEGLYIKERSPPASVSESSLSTVGVFGRTLKGPLGTPVVVTSEARFLEVFGGGYEAGVLVNDIWKSLLNKGMSSLVVSRVASASSVKASFTVETLAGGAGVAIARIDATSVGTHGNLLQFKVSAATSAVATQWNLTIQDTITGRSYLYENADTSTGIDTTLTVLGSDTEANPITITKLASGRPVNNAASTDGADVNGFTFLGQVVTAFVSVAGTSATVVDADYYGASKGLDNLKDYPGIGVIYCAEYMSANLKTQCLTAAAAASDRMFVIGANDSTVLEAAAITDAASYRSDRLIYAFNHPFTVDPITGTQIATFPTSWMACVLSNTDVDIHPGEEDTKRFLAGITKLQLPSVSRTNYVAFKAAGISALEVDLGSPVFVSGLVTLLTSGKTEITRRRMTDFLQLSLASALRYSVKKKNTAPRRMANVGMITAFLDNLQRADRIVSSYLVDGEILNTPVTRGQNIEKVLIRVKLVGHMNHIVLETEIGTSVLITVRA